MSESRERENWSATPPYLLFVAPPPAPRRMDRWKDAERVTLPPPAAGGALVCASSGGAKSAATKGFLDLTMSEATFWLSGSLFFARKPSIVYSTSLAKCFTTKPLGPGGVAPPLLAPGRLAAASRNWGLPACSLSSFCSSASSEPLRRMHSSASSGSTPAGLDSRSSIVLAAPAAPGKSTVSTLMPWSAYCFCASMKMACTKRRCSFSLA
mmetsp:Transcript_3005/g.8761  ORF Transcript_3005/g.8761 Transcript_3005/m.8761 type:complete len:210 (+) Transcript_3005:667-1296(+)